ncbi:MAG: ComF family protein [Bacteroidetes bacterium]|nr:ComF family protein [Bacteroidota bacterium]
MMSVLLKMAEDLSHLIFPRNCIQCKSALTSDENLICSCCMAILPQTGYWKDGENPMYKILHARCGITHASSLYFFEKQNSVREILHHIKYRNNQKLAIRCGEIFGHILINENSWFHDNEFVMLPVPLHPDRMISRGYNQSFLIATGLIKAINGIVSDEYCERIISTSSQTKRDRYDRWINSKALFKMVEPEKISFKNVLIVDDVFTTGATVEALVHTIEKHEPKSISVVTLAFTDS